MNIKWQKGVFITLLVVLMVLLFYAGMAFAANIATSSSNIVDQDEEARWDKPHKYVINVSTTQYFSVEDLYLPKRFAPGEYYINFSDGGEYSYWYAGGKDYRRGSWTFSELNGNILEEHQLGGSSESDYGFGGGGGFDFDGGTLIFNTSADGISYLFMKRSVLDESMYENKFSINFTEDTFVFIKPFSHLDEESRNYRLTVKIDKVDGEFTALFYDDNFHLLAEVYDVSSADIQIPSGQSSSVFVVLSAQNGGDFNVEFDYVHVPVFRTPAFLILIIAIIFVIYFVAKRIVKLFSESIEE